MKISCQRLDGSQEFKTNLRNLSQRIRTAFRFTKNYGSTTDHDMPILQRFESVAPKVSAMRIESNNRPSDGDGDSCIPRQGLKASRKPSAVKQRIAQMPGVVAKVYLRRQYHPIQIIQAGSVESGPTNEGLRRPLCLRSICFSIQSSHKSITHFDDTFYEFGRSSGKVGLGFQFRCFVSVWTRIGQKNCFMAPKKQNCSNSPFYWLLVKLLLFLPRCFEYLFLQIEIYLRL